MIKLIKTPAAISAFILAVFAMLGTALVALTFNQTAEQIKENERAVVLREIHKLVSVDSFDNDLLSDYKDIQVPALSSKPIRVYRARRHQQPVAVVFSPVLASGYNGSIRLIIAVMENAQLGGVRVLSHRETPGLGDKIEESRSNWILGFTGKSLTNPDEKQWKVKKDGGVYDQFTGATVTPRGIVEAVRRTLRYYQQEKTQLFTAPLAIKTNGEQNE